MMARQEKFRLILALVLMLGGAALLGSFVLSHLSTAKPSAEELSPSSLPIPQSISKPGKSLSLKIGDESWQIVSQALTVGELLAEQGLNLHPRDELSPSADTEISEGLQIEVQQARQLWVQTASGAYSGISAALTVGEALQELGLSLQGMDESQPKPDAPLPEDGKVIIKRVNEAISLVTEETPAGYRYEEDPETALDQESVLTQAIPGYTVTRNRSRIVDGVASAGQSEGPWKASDPVDGLLGRGSKVVVHTELVDGVELRYWRKLSVYATGYNPTSNGGLGTASGIPLTKGVIAVELAWYQSGLAFQKAYVPGYGFGTIADTGRNILGHPWIDLGFDDDNYVSWHHWTTLYLLEPVPAYVPLVMP